MALTTKQIDAAKPSEKARKLFDGDGLYLEIRPNGAKLWRLKYRHAGKENRISFGAYPEVTLKEARLRCISARQLLRDGTDPSLERKQASRARTAVDPFETFAREWFGRWQTTRAPTHSARVLRALERDVFPKIGRMPLAAIEPVTVLPVLRAIEDRGAVETAHRVKQVLGMVFRYGVATGRCPRDPTSDLRGALAPVQVRHHPAILKPEPFGELLRAIDGYIGQPATAWALRLAPLVFVRPGELRQAEWAEVDLAEATWTIPALKMKLRRDHVVPLARQALEVMREAHVLTGRGRYVFPSVRTGARPISDNTLNAALRRLGYGTDELTCHGFRASFRTMGAELLGFRAELMEHQLAHAVRDPLGRAYNRAEHLTERREMMQRWADYLERLRAGEDGMRSPAASGE